MELLYYQFRDMYSALIVVKLFKSRRMVREGNKK
jgi:hypothetical protein